MWLLRQLRVGDLTLGGGPGNVRYWTNLKKQLDQVLGSFNVRARATPVY